MSSDPQKRVETAPRVRIAPSPTGGLHIGTARTALFNWLYAKKHRGTFILRIEDTDRARSTKQHEQTIIEDLRWLGLEWDEGVDASGNFGPYRQTERSKLYQPYLDKLLEMDAAYPCYCSPQELEQARATADKSGKPPLYSGRCAALTPEQRTTLEKSGRPCIYRFRTSREPIEVRDEVRGTLRFHGDDFGDFVIAKSDRSPLFLLANVIDDAHMKISHVIRGDDHLPNLPKQILIYRALGFDVPHYAHVPLILNPDRSKMSKRAGPTHVGEYRRLGFLPDAIINYIALLGWNPGTTQELFSRDGLIKAFNLRQINKAGAVFDLTRLKWMNGQYLRKLSLSELAVLVEPFWPAESNKLNIPAGELTQLKMRALQTVHERMTHLAELTELTRFYFTNTVSVDAQLLTWKKSTPEQSVAALKSVRDHLDSIDPSFFKSAEKLEETLKSHAQGSGRSVGEVFWPLRVALSSSKASPGPQEIIWVLGRQRALQRIDSVLKQIK